MKMYLPSVILAACSLSAFGHGTVSSPISRVYTIYLEGPDSPDTSSAMAAVTVAGANQYYTWNQVSKNIANYADAALNTTYASVIPDGKLASGDSGSGLNFSGMDLVSPNWDWPATSATAGVLPVIWKATAPHNPSYFKVWITTADYDHKQPLSWDKMEFLGRIDPDTSTTPGFTTSGNDYLFNLTLPARSGRHVLYVAWQRVDPVGECFFSTSDLIFEDPPDPNAPPVASIVGGTVTEDTGTIEVSVNLNKPVATGETASVNFATSAGSATAADFTANSGTLNFAAGEQSKTINISITDDSDEESEESFTVTLNTPVDVTLGTASASVTITDDDAPPSNGSVVFDQTQDWGTGYQGWLRITNNGTESWTNPTVTFDLDQPISFNNPGTRSNDGAGHWTLVDTNVTIAPGETLSIDLVIQPVSASDPRGPSNVMVNGNTIDPPGGGGTGTIAMTAISQIITEGDSGTSDLNFTVNLSRAPNAGEIVSVNYMAHGHGATMGTDFLATSGILTFAEGEASKVITVPVLGDQLDEKLEIIMVHFTLPVGLIMNTAEVVGQIIDNDFQGNNFGNQRVIAYLDATSGVLNLPPADRVTHIMYGFANLAADGSISIQGPGLSGVNALKSTNPNLKVGLSIGGWTWSGNFVAVASDPAKRVAFAQACRAAIVANDLDGIDIDWEWPGIPGGPGTSPTPQDGANYTLLLQDLRTELDDLELDDGIDKHYEISAFTSASPSGIAQLELSALSEIFDFVNAQGYDLHGPWDAVTGHNAGLFDNSADPGDDRLNIKSVLDQYLAGGFAKDQLLIGAPFYARTFNGAANTANGAFQSHSSSGTTPLYRDLGSRLTTLPRYWDAVAKVPFLYNSATGEWTSYDDPQAMYEKANYSATEGFGGVFYWRNGGDTPDRQLLTTISDTLAFADPDTDKDGILDAWETTNFGNLNDANETTDWDKDGSPDLSESYFITNPKDHTAFPRISRMDDNGGGEFAAFQTVVGARYQMERSTDLENWSPHSGLIEGDGSLIEIKMEIGVDYLYFRMRAIGP